MQINSSAIGQNIQSFTVSGASIEDDIAFGLEALAKLKYKNIYISADPWILNLYDGQNRYKSVADLYRYWATRMRSSTSPIPFLKTGVRNVNSSSDSNYFCLVRSFIALDNQYNIPSHGDVEAISKKSYDGSHIYNQRYAMSSNENISKGFKEILNYAMANFEYDNEAISNLEAFVSYLKRKNFNVTLVLSPYHHQLYQLIQGEKPIFLELESWYRDFADKNKIQIIGSYYGGLVGCDGNEFFDGMHPKNSCIMKLFTNIND